MTSSYKAVKYLATTEKGVEIQPLNKYIFAVEKKASKQEIRKAVEGIYKVKVESVNTLMARGKKRRVRYKEGKTPDTKKAIVTLREGHKIEVGT